MGSKKHIKKKFLFYFCGKPVFEGDETHKTLERIRTEFGGDIMKAVKHDAEKVKRLLKGL